MAYAISAFMYIVLLFISGMVVTSMKPRLWVLRGTLLKEHLLAYSTAVYIVIYFRYGSNLHEAKAMGIKKDITQGILVGIFSLCVYCCYGLSFW